MTARGHRRTAIECRTKTKAMRPQRGRGGSLRRQTSTTVQEDNPEEGPSAAAGTPAPSSPADSDITASQDTDPGEGPCTRPPSVVSGATSESPTLGEDEDQQGEEQQRDEEGDADYGERPLRRPPQRAARTHEAYLRTAARTHELMAERTEVLRRMTDLRLQQQDTGECISTVPSEADQMRLSPTFLAWDRCEGLKLRCYALGRNALTWSIDLCHRTSLGYRVHFHSHGKLQDTRSVSCHADSSCTCLGPWFHLDTHKSTGWKLVKRALEEYQMGDG
uniref:Uncharacterized protein n=1 Tax=Sphaerodactylus townsendi TaxID=933632 RepID=A0ACB8F7V4_9SAUR